MATPTGIPGQPVELDFEFLNEESGVLTDPSSVQLDVTYGSEAPLIPDVVDGGPFTYSGASSPSTAQIYRTGTGTYSFLWNVPSNAFPGAYVANWTVGFQGDTYLFTENFLVTGSGFSVPVPAGDLGYWTGGIIYDAAGLDVEFGKVDSNGIAWLLNKVQGWDGSDIQGGGLIPKSGDHGAWASPQYYAARQITLTVTASAPTQALRDVARATLQQAVPVSDLATFRYDEPVPKMTLCRRSGKVTETYPTLCDVQFTIPLSAPDPRKYGTTLQTVTFNAAPSTGGGAVMPITFPMVLPPLSPGGSIAVTNAGTFETRPLITITGPISSPALVNVTTGQTVSWTGLSVPAGQPFAVDFSIAQATLNGSYRSADPFSSWWTLPPGTSTIAIQGQGDAGASVSVQWYPAWS